MVRWRAVHGARPSHRIPRLPGREADRRRCRPRGFPAHRPAPGPARLRGVRHPEPGTRPWPTCTAPASHTPAPPAPTPQEASAVLYPDARPLLRRHLRGRRATHVRDGEAAAGVLPIENSLAGLVVETWDLLAEGDAADRRRGRDAHPALPGGACRARRSTASTRDPLAPRRAAAVPALPERPLRPHRHVDDVRRGARRRRGRRPDAGRDRLARAPPTGTGSRSCSRRSPTTRRTSRASSPSRAARAAVRAAACPGGRRCGVVTDHRPGALHEAIEPFRYHGVNMVSLHSRPIPGEPWRYQFSIDIDGHRDEETVQRALARRASGVRRASSCSASTRRRRARGPEGSVPRAPAASPP